jgi:hypothetical protein
MMRADRSLIIPLFANAKIAGARGKYGKNKTTIIPFALLQIKRMLCAVSSQTYGCGAELLSSNQYSIIHRQLAQRRVKIYVSANEFCFERRYRKKRTVQLPS